MSAEKEERSDVVGSEKKKEKVAKQRMTSG